MAQQEDIISSYVDRSGIESDTKFMLDNLNKVLGGLQEASKFKISLDNAGSFKQVSQILTQYGNVQKEVLEANEKLAQSIKKSGDAQKDVQKAFIEARVAKQQYNKELKTEIELQTAASSSIAQARAANKLLLAERNNLNLSTEEGIKKLAELNAAIDKNNEFIKQNVDQLSRQKINIGNYNGAAKIIVDALGDVEKKIESLREKQTTLQNLSKSNPIGFKLGNQAQELEQVNALLATTEKEYEALNNITSSPQFFNVSKVGNARTEIRGFTTTLVELEQKGLGKTNFANELRKRLAELTDQVADTREEIKAMSSDSRGFDQLNSSVKFLTNSYQTFVGIQALAGDQSEDVQKTIQKLIAVQAVANGLQEVAQVLTTRGTIINKAYAYVQGLVTIATDSTAAATTRLNAALKLSTIGLLIGAVTLVVMKYKEWFGTSQKVLDQQKALDDFNGRIADSYVEQKRTLDGLVDKLKDENISLTEKKKIVKELQDQYPNYLGNLKIEKGEVVGLTEGYNKLVQAILLKSRSQAAGELLAEQEKELLKQGLQVGVTSFEQADKLYEKYKDTKGVVAGIFLTAYENARATRNELTKIKAEADDALSKLGGDPTTKPTKDKPVKDNKAQIEKDMRAIFEVYKVQKERELELLNGVVEDDKQALGQRVAAAIIYVETKQKLIADEAEFEKEITKASAAERQLIDKKAAVARIRTAEEMEKKLLEIKEKLKKDPKSNIDVFGSIDVSSNSTYNKIIKQLEEYEKKQKLIAETEKQLATERKERLRDFSNQLREAILSFATISLENQGNKIEDQINQIDRRKEKEIDAANQSITNERARNEEIAKINAKAAAQREVLEKRQKDIEIRKAKLEKESALLSVAIDTAKQVFKIKSEAAVLLANPVTAPYAAVALAQIPFVVGSGLLAAAAIAARPLPKYYKGKSRSDNYEGIAWTGEKGYELIERKTGEMELTPNKATLTKVNKGDIIYTHEQTKDKLKQMAWNATISAVNKTPVVNISSGLTKDDYLYGVKKIERAVKNIKLNVRNPTPLDLWMKQL